MVCLQNSASTDLGDSAKHTKAPYRMSGDTDLEMMLLWAEGMEGSITRVDEHEDSSLMKVIHILK